MPSADPRLELDQVVEQLLESYRHPDDRPQDHKCVKSLGYAASLGYDERVDAGVVEIYKSSCDHGEPRSLMARLADLIEPGQRGLSGGGGGKAPKGPKGSPAPWAAQPAELLDEIQRGVIELHDSVRRVLGLPLDPAYRNTTLHARARHALRSLPADLLLLEAGGRVEHWLASTECPGKPKCTIRREHRHPGGVEQRIRSWHRRALLVTGHEQKRAKVGQVENPNHPANTDRPYLGPICATLPVVKACDVHESCDLMRHDRLNRYQQARCPYCHSVSLEQDPDSGHVECARPSCRDSEGHRHMWTVEELAHLGLVIVTESEA